MARIFRNGCNSSFEPGRLLVLILVVSSSIPAFSQDFSQKFQKTSDGSGYYRNLGDIGFINPYSFWKNNTPWYLDEGLYGSGEYASIMKGKIWVAFVVISVPESIRNEILNTKKAKGTEHEACLMEEFIFPYEEKTSWGATRKCYWVIAVYGQETWGYLDCASAFSVKMEAE